MPIIILVKDPSLEEDVHNESEIPIYSINLDVLDKLFPET